MEHTLKELGAEFVRHVVERNTIGVRRVENKAYAHGIMFACPLCFDKNGGLMGTHAVICWSRSAGAPDDASPGPNRWLMTGRNIGELTLDSEIENGDRSITLTSGCGWRGYVTNGKAG